MIKIFKYLTGKELRMALASLVFIVFQVWMELTIPQLMAQITTLVQTPDAPVIEIWRAGGFMLLSAFGSLVAAVCVGYFAAMIGARFSRKMRSELFNKVDSFSMEEVNNFSTDSLITRATNDITQVQSFITMGLTVIVRAPIMAFWAFTRIAGKGFEWTVATGITIVILLTFIAGIMVLVIPKFRKMQALIDNMNRVTRENLTGLRVVRAYNAEDYQEEKFEKANDELTYTQLFTGRVMAIIWPMLSLFMGGLTLVIYWIGAHLIETAEVTDRLPLFASMVVFSNYGVQVIMSFMMLTMIFFMLPRSAVSANRINEVLETEPTIVDGARTEGLEGVKGEVTFKNVSFKYPDANEYVLEGINFTVKQGETIAFIGSTGSGKSTLINLIPRFFEATDGEILVNGVNVRDYTIESLNNKIGYVSQKAVLFRGDVTSNVALGDNGKKEYSEADVKRAIAIAQGTAFVEAKEGGYKAEITQGGTNVSGGQKQRLAIARAICREPEIYIFDDSFSALDYKTDRVLRSELKKETAGVTNMIVAQRIGTIMDANQIIVLDEGKIVGTGTHRELLQTCDVYKQIAMSQLSEEELAI
ncbi:MAG: ABC transporter ATP-binding protein/permease [Turicibacter sp.]|nr:ABC transporter ATP-binding protein/permease [Turicibacter sp.]